MAEREFQTEGPHRGDLDTLAEVLEENTESVHNQFEGTGPSAELRGHLEKLAIELNTLRAELISEKHRFVSASRLQRDAERTAEQAARDRDHFGRLLVLAEQERAGAIASGRKEAELAAELRQRLDEVVLQNVALNRELEAIRRTLSWRITGPLRKIRRYWPGQFGR